MAVAKTTEVLELIKQMTVMELVELISAAEKEFNVSAQSMAMPMMGMPMMGGAAGGQAVEEKTEFTVKLKAAGANKVNAIKVVREITSLGLKEAKDLVESAPTVVKEGLSKKDAEDMLKKLQEAGAEAEIQ